MSFRYDPFERMERMMEQMRRSFAGEEPLLALPESGWGAADINLSLETEDDGYVVLADIPGFDKSELDLRFDDGVLTIQGDHDVAGRRRRRRGHGLVSQRRPRGPPPHRGDGRRERPPNRHRLNSFDPFSRVPTV